MKKKNAPRVSKHHSAPRDEPEGVSETTSKRGGLEVKASRASDQKMSLGRGRGEDGGGRRIRTEIFWVLCARTRDGYVGTLRHYCLFRTEVCSSEVAAPPTRAHLLLELHSLDINL